MAVSAAGLALLLASAAPVAAQETVWSSVAFVLYGERTPLEGANTPELTPSGAQQLYEQGAVFRARYLGGSNETLSDEMSNITTSAPIAGIEQQSLDNHQISVQSLDNSYAAASALAFLQGLYPPQTSEFADGNGGLDTSVLADNTVVNFPLSGYQYPLVETPSSQDPASTWIDGSSMCTSYQQSILSIYSESPSETLYTETLDFYQSLWSSVFQSAFSKATTNYYYAYDLYDYASYQYDHNPQVANVLDSGELSILRTLAYTQQINLNANLTASGLEQGDMIRAISGRMLARHVVNVLKDSISADGSTGKLNIMVGDFAAFLAFFTLADLNSGTTADVFQDLPDPGAAMVWELYSESDNASVYPSTDDLFVRFLYRPNTDNGTALTQYGLFATDTTTSSMSFASFVAAMDAVGIPSVTQWCSTCGDVSVFCASYKANTDDSDGDGDSDDTASTSRSKYKMSLAVAGVIGALIMGVIMSLLAVIAILVVGVRVHRVKASASNGAGAAENGLGGSGFKGEERKPGDMDVAVSRTGARHERVGSWELNAGNSGASGVSAEPESVAGVLQKSGVHSTMAQTDDDDDDMVALTGPPVVPREHV